MLHLTPLTLGSMIVGVVLAILLVISVVTLLVSRHNRKARRRQHTTRCQLAIRLDMYGVSQQKTDAQNFNCKETFKK